MVRPGVLAWALLLGAAAPAFDVRAQELEEALSGFEEDSGGEPDDVLRGFEDDAPRAEDLADELPEERFFDLSGSAEVSGSLNVRDHESATGANYHGLSRLRSRLNLQLDLDLPRDWKARVAGFAFYDAAYRIRGRGEFSGDVRSQYEWEMDLQEVYVMGSPLPALDVKLGRQVVNWGRSDTIRVLDILNPLDVREPGRVDIEDLRRPVAMARFDTFLGDWSLTAVAVPEIRFDQGPVPGSDFFPGATGVPHHRPDDSFENSEVAASLTGIFQGWDVSFQAARYWDDQPHLGPRTPPRLEHARLWMLGSGGNYTTGAWLLKGEIGYFEGFEFFTTGDSKARLDALVGVEYYGFQETTLALEAANRRVLDHESRMSFAPDFRERNSEEIALRYTADFLNARLHVTGLAVLFGWRAQGASVLRLAVDYDLRDALVLSAGVLLFQNGDAPVAGRWGSNDRLVFGVKYSF